MSCRCGNTCGSTIQAPTIVDERACFPATEFTEHYNLHSFLDREYRRIEERHF